MDIYIRSEGCNDPGKTPGTCGIAYIYVNGKDHSVHGRGHNVVVVDDATGNYAPQKSYTCSSLALRPRRIFALIMYLFIYLFKEYARTATIEADNKRNIYENTFFLLLCIGNYTLLFSRLCPVRWNVANYTPHCNRPSGIFVLAGFSGETSLGWPISHWAGFFFH